MNFDIYQYDRKTLFYGEQLPPCLSQDEEVRASSFSFPEAGQWYRICRTQLRIILAQYLHCEPKAINFAYNTAGKPELATSHQSDLQFNMSHTKEKLIIAVHPSHKIGVDIEKIEPRNNLSLAERFFCPGEFQTLKGLAQEEQLPAFYRLWVCKEALAKALGVGIYDVLSKVEFTGFVEGRKIAISNLDYKDVRLQLLAVDETHCAAVAVMSTPSPAQGI